MVSRQAMHKERWTEHRKRTQAVKWEDRETRQQAAPDFIRPGERETRGESPEGAARGYFNSIKEKRTYTGVVLLFLQRGCHE